MPYWWIEPVHDVPVLPSGNVVQDSSENFTSPASVEAEIKYWSTSFNRKKVNHLF